MAASDVVEVAFVVPASGPSGIYGPSCSASGALAVAEVNAAGGLLGRELRIRPVDGGRPPAVVAGEVAGLVERGAVSGVTGWHTSAVRRRIAARLAGAVPYVYTAVYEGGERSPGVYLTGETPSAQLLPAMRWMAQERGVRSWVVVGNDYVWPRESAGAARGFAELLGVEIRDEVFVPLGSADYRQVLERVRRSRARGVLMFLLGSDASRFNRAFAAMRLDEQCVRLSPLMDENMLMASGPGDTTELYSAAGYFESLGSAHGLDFERRYVGRFGARAPALTSPGESCFEGMTLLARLADAARSTDVARIDAVAESVGYDGPRGSVRIHDQHLVQNIYLARADGFAFDVLAEIHAGT